MWARLKSPRWADIISGRGRQRAFCGGLGRPPEPHLLDIPGEISPKVDTRRLRAIEAEHIVAVAESFRLNMPAEKYTRVMELLAAGAKYADIRVSMGMISKLKRTYGAPSDSDRVRVSTHRTMRILEPAGFTGSGCFTAE